MTENTLIENPLYRESDLGKALPSGLHANSVCLPRWSDVVGYEEGDPAVVNALECGYPRFVYNNLVVEACALFKPSGYDMCQIYASRSSAERCRDFLLIRHPEENIVCVDIENSSAVLIAFSAELAAVAKEFWQHTGEGISSRQAEALINNKELPDGSVARNQLLCRIAELNDVDESQVFLFSCGMSALFAVHRACLRLFPNLKASQFSFPYTDTLKVLEKFGSGAHFYPNGNDTCFQKLEQDLKETKLSSLFCEFPTNPLLACVDLRRLKKISSANGFPLVVDETLGSYGNVDVLSIADVTATSLTKFFSGSGDVTGGAVIINPDSVFALELKREIAAEYERGCYCSLDIIEMERTSRTYLERMTKINATSEALCDYLDGHPKIDQIFYPKLTGVELYDSVMKENGGYGGLFSIVLKNAENVTETFYDALKISKGPNLGTYFSLCCPFTLLAHYTELEFAEACGVSRYLIRISIGLEDFELMKSRIDDALALI